MNNYIKPNTTIVSITSQHMIAASPTPGFDPTDTTDGMDAKGGFLWDEDEDDDPMGAPSYNVWEE